MAWRLVDFIGFSSSGGVRPCSFFEMRLGLARSVILAIGRVNEASMGVALHTVVLSAHAVFGEGGGQSKNPTPKRRGVSTAVSRRRTSKVPLNLTSGRRPLGGAVI